VKNPTRPAIFKWRQTAPELILSAVRWYLRYSLSLRDVEELGSVATLRVADTMAEGRVDVGISGYYFEELLDELNLTWNVSSTHPPNLSLPDHVHRLISLNRSPRRLEFSESLLGVHTPFDGSMVLLQNVV